MSYLSTILNDEPLWTAISQYTLGQTRPSTGDFQLKLHCPMCVSQGTTQDGRWRCGIARKPDGIVIHCFNCLFTTGFTVGQRLGRNMAAFLIHLGVPHREVKELRFWSQRIASLVETAEKHHPEYVPVPTFAAIGLPEGCKSLETWADEGCDDPDYLDTIDYLLGRGDVATLATTYYWTPVKFNRRLIIPCLHDGHMVGWIGRSIDPQEKKKKYYNQTPKSFLFNDKFLTHPFRKYIFIVEGVFDALVIDGVAIMGAAINAQQIQWIKQSGKTPIVVPDRDEAGKALIRVALAQNWGVAFPNYAAHTWWDDGIKDVDEAVRKYGKLYVVRSIISSVVTDSIKIKQRMTYTPIVRKAI
jgi:hypothetical protein